MSRMKVNVYHLCIACVIALGLCAMSGCGGAEAPATHTDAEDHAKHDEHGEHDEHDHDEHAHAGPHGGEILEVGEEVLHLELLHDGDAGKVTIHVYDMALKNGVSLAKAPVLNLTTPEGPKQLAMTGSGAEFSATDAALKAEPLTGRIALEFEGKPYQVTLVDPHGHDHDH